MPERIRFLDTDLNLTTKAELWEAIRAGETVRVATVNPEFMLEAEHNPGFREALANMTHCIIDGSGLLGLLKFGRKKLRITQPLELYHGSDLVADLITEYQDGSKSFFFLGGLENASELAAENLRQQYPTMKMLGAIPGGVIDRDHPYTEGLGQAVLQAKPDILLVGMGAPRQELWIHSASAMPIQIMVGVGGTFNFYGNKKRAPEWMRKTHFEWLYRVVTEKGHLRRAWQAVVVFPLRARKWLSQH